MKKILGLGMSILGLCLSINTFASSNQSKCIDFTNDTLCIQITKDGNNTFRLSHTTNKNSTNMLICDILTPNMIQHQVGSCNKSFSYNGNGIENIKLYVMLNNEYKAKSFLYDFSQGYFVDGEIRQEFIQNNEPVINRDFEERKTYSQPTFTTIENTPSQSSNNQTIPEESFITSLEGFTQTQLQDVKAVYKLRPRVVAVLEKRFPIFSTDQKRMNRQIKIYNDTIDILQGNQNRAFKTYNSYYNEMVNFVLYSKELKNIK